MPYPALLTRLCPSVLPSPLRWGLVAACLWGCPSPSDAPASKPPGTEVAAPTVSGRTAQAVPTRASATTAIALARTPEGLVVDVPPSSRPGGVPASNPIAVTSPFTRKEARGDVIIWKADLPVDPHLFPGTQAGARSFGNYDPPGLQIHDAKGVLRFRRHAHGPRSFGYTREHLLIGLPKDAPPPTGVALTWDKAIAADLALNAQSFGETGASFALRTLTIDRTAHTGVLLPAPGRASWPVTIPLDGVFHSRVQVMPPPVHSGERSDGASVSLVIRTDAGEETLATASVREGEWTTVRADLAAFAGQAVTVELRSDPAGTPVHDHVFWEEPTLYTPSPTPRRVVLLFLDTLRRDHLGLYGYERDTSPHLDTLAADATVFEAARTVAPWTLPSARALLSGRQPEAWFDTQTLPAALAAAGFYTEGLVANAYLSQTFDMHRGFGRYTYDHLRPAPKTVAHAVDVLETFPDRDVMLYLQFMEAHLPYMEPKGFRSRFAGPKPKGLKSVARTELVQLKDGAPDAEAIRQHVTDRYDQNIAYLDDSLQALLDALPDDATVVVFADHGEELWDHGGFEHGHTFYDELLRVPLIVRSPYLPQARVQAPVSLLDVTPTVLALMGLPTEDDQGARDGIVLRDAAQGEDAAVAALTDRPQAFGRPLYGDDGWGVLSRDAKWWSRGGRTRQFDLSQDPAEQTDRGRELPIEAQSTYAEATADALHSPVRPVWRVSLSARRNKQPTQVVIRHPDGLAGAWKAYDPRGTYAAVQVRRLEDGAIELIQPANEALPRELYLAPHGDPSTPADATGLTLTFTQDGDETVHTVASPKGDNLYGPTTDRYKVEIDQAWAPLPFGQAVSGWDEDLADQLKELGYAE